MSARDSDPASGTAASHDPLIGARIAGRYRIDRIHARGGMSIVYSATYEAQQREVAIKVLDEGSASDPEAIQRFEHEARTASSLSHGHVVGVSDFGRLPDGRPYLVMPMIMGQDLATLVSEQGPMPAARVAALLAGVASALDAMHAQGLVHRDIKSENIMYVRADSGAESALVLDFGIAAAPSAIHDGQMVDTSGTPDFMAPEALAGAPSDHRADVYSLATVAFELLTGRLPYDGNDLSDLLRRRARNKPRTLADATGLRFHRSLEAVFARGLARDPDNRPSSAGELIRELAAAAAQARAPLSTPPKAPPRKAITLRALAMHALSSGPSAAAPRLARLRTLVGLPFNRPPSTDAKVKKPLPAPTRTPGSGVHRKPAPPQRAPVSHAAPPPEPSIMVDPSLLAAGHPPRPPAPLPRQQPIDSLSPVSELADDEPAFKAPTRTRTRLGIAAAAAVAVLAVRLWSRANDPSPSATSARPAEIAAPKVALEAPAPPPPVPPPAVEPPPVAVIEPPPARATERPAPAPAEARKLPRAARRPARSVRRQPVAAPEPERAVLRVTPSASASAPDLTQQAVDAMLRGDFGAALAKLDGAIAASPRYAPAFRSKGLVLERMGRRADAAKAFRQYLRLEPNARDADKIEARLTGLE